MTDQAPKFRWGHININVSNLDQSIGFYKKLGFDVFMPSIPYLGLSATAAEDLCASSGQALGLPADVSGRACIMQLGTGFPKLDLTEYSSQSQKPPLTNIDLGLVRVCLVSQDLQADYARLRDLGVKFLTPPQPCQDGLADMATCVDPDGTLIELLQVYLEKWPR